MLDEDIPVPFVSLVQRVVSDGPATEEQLQTVAREVEKFCPLSKLFVAAGTAVETVWTKA